MDVEAFRKYCGRYKCILCRDNTGNHRAQDCPIAQECGYEVKFDFLRISRSNGRQNGSPAAAPAAAPAPAPAPTSSTTGTNGTNSTSTGYSARRVVRTTHYVLGIARRAEPSESPTKSRSACPDSGASDDMHHDRDSLKRTPNSRTVGWQWETVLWSKPNLANIEVTYELW